MPTNVRVYVGVVFAFGVAAIAHSMYGLASDPVGYQSLILAALTLVSGSATVRIPSVPAAISVSETFVFTSVLLFGVQLGL